MMRAHETSLRAPLDRRARGVASSSILVCALIALACACGDDGEEATQGVDRDVTGKGAATSMTGKPFAEVCDSRIGEMRGSCNEYYSEDPKFTYPETVICAKVKTRCPSEGVVGTCVQMDEADNGIPYEKYLNYYFTSELIKEACTESGGTWLAK